MKAVTETDRFVVYDEVVANETYEEMWNFIQNIEYAGPHSSGWTKVWRLNDGSPFGSQQVYHTDAPFNSPFDHFHQVCLEMDRRHPELTGEWEEISMRAYLYPRGTKLSWHNDTGYEGAVIMYVHPYWGSTWGGELMIAQTPEGGPTLPHIDHRHEDQFLAAMGAGYYVTAKPNRVVLQRANVWHQINRIDDDAGDHVRAALVGFYKKSR